MARSRTRTPLLPAVALLLATLGCATGGDTPVPYGDPAGDGAPPVLLTLGERLAPQRAEIRHAHAATFHESALAAAALRLPLAGGGELTLWRDRVESRGGGDYTWFGDVDGEPLSQAVFVVRRGRLTGQVSSAAGIHRVRPRAGGGHTIVAIDPGALPPEAEPIRVATSAPAPLDPLPVADEDLEITVLVVYTAAAAAAAQDIEAEVHEAIDVTNESYRDSDVSHRLTLADTREITYAETADPELDAERLRDAADGHLDEVHGWRDDVHADLVVLLVDDLGPACGIGYQMGTPTVEFADHAFSVVDRDCASTSFSFAHETGHNLGAHHDRHVTQDDGAFPYSHGFVRVGSWRTIMAYSDACTDQGDTCPRIAHWSNPDVDHGWQPTGIDEAQPDSADNAQTLDRTAAVAAAFRDDRPRVPDTTAEGWFAGDGHLHGEDSRWDAAYLPLVGCPRPTSHEVMRAAALSGLSWAVLTDHEDMTDAAAWQASRDGMPAALADVQAAYPTALLTAADVGEELGTSIPPGDLLPDWLPDLDETRFGSLTLGHFLGYGMSSFVAWNEEIQDPDDAYYPSAAAMMQAVYADGAGSVAHPFDRWNPWQAWADLRDQATAHGVGFEVINGGALDGRALQTWQDYLHSGLRLVAVGNSDAHCPGDVAGGVTYVRPLPQEALDADVVTTAIEAGRAVASSGPFASLTAFDPVTGQVAEIGDTLSADVGQPIDLSLYWRTHDGGDPDEPRSFGEIRSIRVYDRSHRYAADPQLDNPLALDEPLDADHGVAGTWGSSMRSYTASASGALWMLAETTTGHVVVSNPIYVEVPGSPFGGSQLDTALILDSSGSMGSNDPDDHRLDAAMFYVDLSRPGDHVAVVDFDGNAVVRASLQEATANRDALHAAIAQIDSSGSTDLSDGLNAGYAELAASDTDHTKIAILLTDGEGSYAGEAAAFASRGWRIYTVGLSLDADAALLQAIADETGGTFTLVETLADAEDALERIYRDIATDVTGLTELLEDDATLLPGETASWLFDVTADMDLLRVTITWPGSEFDLRLTQPDGTILDEAAADPDVAFAEGDTYALFSVAYPMAGEWTAEVTAVDVDPAGETVGISVAANTSTMPDVWFGAPDAGGEMGGTVAVDLAASDPEGVTTLTLAVDDVELGWTDGDTLLVDWDTSAVDDGLHTLWATVRDVDGNVGTATRSVYVLNDTASVPAIDAGADRDVAPGEAVTLTATPINDAAVGAAVLWELGDGELAAGAEVEHVYAAPGEYVAIAHATSGQRLTGYDDVVITVFDPADADDDGDGYSENLGDCDDTDPALSPADADGDGVSSCDGDCDDSDANRSPLDLDGDGYSSCAGDCDDLDASVDPGDADQDGWSTCDGDCDDHNNTLGLADLDGDGASSCAGDCDDADPLRNPLDLDRDGFDSCGTPTRAPDCHDADATIFPGNNEACDDGQDNDCDGDVDEADDECPDDGGFAPNEGCECHVTAGEPVAPPVLAAGAALALGLVARRRRILQR